MLFHYQSLLEIFAWLLSLNLQSFFRAHWLWAFPQEALLPTPCYQGFPPEVSPRLEDSPLDQCLAPVAEDSFAHA